MCLLTGLKIPPSEMQFFANATVEVIVEEMQ